MAAGFDCGQLLAGHAESGDLEPGQLEPVLTAVIQEYAAGMRGECTTIDDAGVYLGAVGAFVIRSAFTAIPLELLDAGDTAELRRLFRVRAGYARPDIARIVPEVVKAHPSVEAVTLVGSRAERRAKSLSDWDFEVVTSDFQTLARDSPACDCALWLAAKQTGGKDAPRRCFL